MTFVKHHWFGLILSTVVLIYFIVFILVLAAPKQDKQQRGFAACSAKMLEQVQLCGSGGSWCMLEAVVNNGFCNVGVVFSGIGKWLSGAQETPWANYLYDDEIETGNPDEALQAFYNENPDLAGSMNKLIKQSSELEKKVQKND